MFHLFFFFSLLFMASLSNLLDTCQDSHVILLYIMFSIMYLEVYLQVLLLFCCDSMFRHGYVQFWTCNLLEMASLIVQISYTYIHIHVYLSNCVYLFCCSQRGWICTCMFVLWRKKGLHSSLWCGTFKSIFTVQKYSLVQFCVAFFKSITICNKFCLVYFWTLFSKV